jgi:signal peptidase
MSNKQAQNRSDKILTGVGIALCVILIPILIVNCTLIVKGLVNKDKVPSIGGMMPFIVLSNSMEPDIMTGDVIICKEIDPDDVKIGDVISFYDPAGNGSTVVTHKVVDIVEKDGVRSFQTRGINNNTEDRLWVHESKVIAEYTEIRFPLIGNVAIFMQSTAGLLVCVVVPIVLFVGYDILRRRRYEKNKGDDVAALMAELEALRGAQAANAQKESADASAVDPAPSAEDQSEDQ